MENKDNMNVCGCDCEGCSWTHGSHHGKYWIWKKILVILVILLAFCFGAKYGEIKSYSRMMYGGGYGMMNWGIKDGNAYYKMMPWLNTTDKTNTTTPATPEKTQ